MLPDDTVLAASPFIQRASIIPQERREAMIIPCPKSQFDPIFHGVRTATILDEHGFHVTVGDRIRYEEVDDTGAPTGRTVLVVVTDVCRTSDRDRSPVLSIRRVVDLTEIRAPGGAVRVHADPDDIYCGMALSIDDTIAAVVEWHPDYRSFVIRTYNGHDDEPQHYHRWDGTDLEA